MTRIEKQINAHGATIDALLERLEEAQAKGLWGLAEDLDGEIGYYRSLIEDLELDQEDERRAHREYLSELSESYSDAYDDPVNDMIAIRRYESSY